MCLLDEQVGSLSRHLAKTFLTANYDNEHKSFMNL